VLTNSKSVSIVSIIEAANTMNNNPNINLSSKQTSKVYKSKRQYDLVVNERKGTQPKILALVFENLLVEVDLLLLPPGQSNGFRGARAVDAYEKLHGLVYYFTPRSRQNGY